MNVLDRYVGIPWLDRGRSIVGLDCYGLLRLVFLELRGIELPSFAESYPAAADRKALARLIAGEIDPWESVEVGQEKLFDAALMRCGRELSHIGIVTGNGRLLHVSEGETSRIERYASLSHRIAGFYRYREVE